MLRIKMQNLIKKLHESGYSKEEISVELYDLLDGEGLGIHGNGWSDQPEDLADSIELDDNECIKMSVVSILHDLDLQGLGLEESGWFDDDEQWYDLVEEI